MKISDKQYQRVRQAWHDKKLGSVGFGVTVLIEALEERLAAAEKARTSDLDRLSVAVTAGTQVMAERDKLLEACKWMVAMAAKLEKAGWAELDETKFARAAIAKAGKERNDGTMQA